MHSPRLAALRQWAAYRLDRFLRLHGLVQASLLVGITASLIVFFAIVLAATGGARDLESFGDFLWWSLGRFSDGGTMYPDQGLRVRTIAVIVTWSAIFVVQFMTGAVTAKLTDRLGQLRAGHSALLERNHLLVLGFDSRVPLLARELARSGQRVTLAVLADTSVNEIDTALRPAQRIPGSKLRFETRSGDPREELSLLRVSADRARAVVILAPEEFDDPAATRWGFQTLLALRRIASPDSQPPVILETRHAGDEDLYEAAADAAQPGLAPLRLVQLAGDDIIARVLAQAVRQPGVFFVLREILSFRGAELYFEPVPRRLIDRPFSEAHATIVEGIAVGVHVARQKPQLNPNSDLVLKADDELIVLETQQGAYRVSAHAKLPTPPAVRELEECAETPSRVAVLGDNRALPEFIAELTNALPDKSEIHLFSPSAQATLASVQQPATRVQLRGTDVNPTAIARKPTAELLQAEATVILGSAAQRDLEADAVALETLVCLRHAAHKDSLQGKRLVTELRNLASASHVVGTSEDFLVSTELLGLLIGQLMLNPDLHSVLHDDLLSAGKHDIFLEPRQLYVGEADGVFGQVMSAARRRQEVALGLYLPSRGSTTTDLRALLEGRAEEGASPVWLVPPRDTTIPPDALVIVLGKGEEKKTHEDESS